MFVYVYANWLRNKCSEWLIIIEQENIKTLKMKNQQGPDKYMH